MSSGQAWSTKAFVEARETLEKLRQSIEDKSPPTPMSVYSETISLAHMDKVIEILRAVDINDQSPEAERARSWLSRGNR